MTTTTTTERDGLVYGLDELEYHAGPELSSSGAKLMLEAPALYQHERENRTERRAFDLGHVVHGMLLGDGLDVVVVQTTAKDGTKRDAENYQTKSAQEDRDAIRAEGKVPMLRHELAVAQRMVDKVLEHDDARALLDADGDAEVSAFTTDPATGVRMRARYDLLHRHEPVIVDVKTGQTASPRLWPRKVADLGYDLQAAWYDDVLTAVRGDDAPVFYHIVVESNPPHLVAVHRMSDAYLERGRRRVRAALELYAACVAADRWPGYPLGEHLTEPPPWLRDDYPTPDLFDLYPTA